MTGPPSSDRALALNDRHARVRGVGRAIHQLGFALQVALEDLLERQHGADVAAGVGQRDLGAASRSARRSASDADSVIGIDHGSPLARRMRSTTDV